MFMHHSRHAGTRLVQSLTALAVLLLAVTAQAIETEYYVALDNVPVLTSGTYTGLPNPNYGRLTFLFAHPDESTPSNSHFHAIGAYSYTGPVESPTVMATSSNNRIPEISTGALPLRLLPGTGVYAGKHISQHTGEEYSNLHVASIQALSSFPSGSTEDILFHSSADRWSAPLTDAVVALQLISITPKLHIGDEAGQPVLEQQSRHQLGDGNSLTFFPIFWTEGNARPGTYSVTFKLVDVRTDGTPLGESGRFTLDFRVPTVGDLDGDHDVDEDDVVVLLEALNTPASAP